MCIGHVLGMCQYFDNVVIADETCFQEKFLLLVKKTIKKAKKEQKDVVYVCNAMYCNVQNTVM